MASARVDWSWSPKPVTLTRPLFAETVAVNAVQLAVALARDRTLNGVTATVSANNGRVSVSGLADQEQSEHARQIAQRMAGAGNVSGGAVQRRRLTQRRRPLTLPEDLLRHFFGARATTIGA